MYLNLQDVLADERARLAMSRLYNVSRLEGLKASDEILVSPRELLGKSKKEFGDRFSELEAIYPEYEVWADARNKELMDWQLRCHSCKFGGDALATEDVSGWCEKYSADDRTYPDPCPDYEET